MLECVPNVSEGRRGGVIDAMARAIEASGARLVDIHRDVDHHRSVFTFLGPAAVTARAAVALSREAVETVDLRGHRGVHPRIGAVDVIPFVPLRGASMAEAVRTAHEVGAALAAELAVPVFFFGAAAVRPDRRELSAARAGQFEGLAIRMVTPGGAPDAGPAQPHPRAGAVAVGARRVLIAFNAVIDATDLQAARAIAAAVRESSGGLPALQALGVPLASRGRVQVSMNLLDYHQSGVSEVMALIEAEAARHRVQVLEFELVGCAPADAFRGVDRGRVRMQDHQLLDPQVFEAPDDRV